MYIMKMQIAFNNAVFKYKSKELTGKYQKYPYGQLELVVAANTRALYNGTLRLDRYNASNAQARRFIKAYINSTGAGFKRCKDLVDSTKFMVRHMNRDTSQVFVYLDIFNQYLYECTKMEYTDVLVIHTSFSLKTTVDM